MDICPWTMRRPPTQMASSAANSPASTDTPPNAARAFTRRLANPNACPSCRSNRPRSAGSWPNARTVRTPASTSVAAAPASLCAFCTSAAIAFTRRPSHDEASAIGGRPTSISSVSHGDVYSSSTSPPMTTTTFFSASASSSPSACSSGGTSAQSCVVISPTSRLSKNWMS